MKVKTVNLSVKTRERTLLETMDGKILSLDIDNINANDLLSEDDYTDGFRAMFMAFESISKDEFTTILEELGAQVLGLIHLQDDTVLIVVVPPKIL